MQVVITKCYHLFCGPCIQRNLDLRHRKCPGCGVPFGQNDVRNVYIWWVFWRHWGCSGLLNSFLLSASWLGFFLGTYCVKTDCILLVAQVAQVAIGTAPLNWHELSKIGWLSSLRGLYILNFLWRLRFLRLSIKHVTCAQYSPHQHTYLASGSPVTCFFSLCVICL